MPTEVEILYTGSTTGTRTVPQTTVPHGTHTTLLTKREQYYSAKRSLTPNAAGADKGHTAGTDGGAHVTTRNDTPHTQLLVHTQ